MGRSPQDQQPLTGAGQTISDITIRLVGPVAPDKPLEPLINSLIPIKAGDIFSAQKMADAIKMLEDTKRFSEIYTEVEDEGEEVNLIFKLTPYPLIKDIKIEGAFPVFNTDILRVMTISPGEVFIEDELSQQREWISDLLKNEGYPEAEIEFSFQKVDKENHVIVEVNIKKGPPLVVGDLRVKGNHNISDFWLKSKMKSNPAVLGIKFKTAYNESTLKTDIKKLTGYYREKNYFDAKLDYEAHKTDNHRVNITVTVQEGPLYKIEFQGNDAFSSRKLKKQAVFYDVGNRNDTGIRRTASEIRKFYRENAFSDVTVNHETSDTSKNDKKIRTVTYTIKEGPRSEVENVQIRGNAVISNKEIKKQMLTEKSGSIFKKYYAPDTLQEDIDAIETLYRQKGYLSPEIKTNIEKQEAGGVNVGVEISENTQTRVAAITFKGLASLPEKAAAETLQMKVGDPFRDYMINSDANTLSAHISEKGYPYVKVVATYDLKNNEKEAWIVFNVEESPRVKMGQIFFSGNFKTQEAVLRREFKLHSGGPFSLKKMLEGQTNLRNLGLFKSVKVTPVGLEEKRDVVHFFVELEEYKPYYFELGAGYESQRGLFVNTKIGDKNLFGRNKNLWLEVDVSEIGNRIDLGFIEPRFLGEKITLTSGLFWERIKEFNKSYGTETFGAHAGLLKRLSPRTTAGINLQSEYKDEFDYDPDLAALDPGLEETLGRRYLFTLTPFITYDTRDSFTQPRKGVYGYFTVDVSKGLTTSTDNFIKYRIDLRYFKSFSENITLAWSGKTGLVKSYRGEPNVAIDHLFYLGGISDVRGFDENLLAYDANGKALGGRFAVSSSLELRYLIGNNFVLPLFYDTGKIAQTQAPGVAGRFRSSVGSGVLYLTPIGPIGIFYGLKLDPEEGESKDAFHFTIGYSF